MYTSQWNDNCIKKYFTSCIVIEKSFSYSKKAFECYENYLPGPNDIIKADYEIRQGKWKNIEEQLKPVTNIETLGMCDYLMFQNIQWSCMM